MAYTSNSLSPKQTIFYSIQMCCCVLGGFCVASELCVCLGCISYCEHVVQSIAQLNCRMLAARTIEINNEFEQQQKLRFFLWPLV